MAKVINRTVDSPEARQKAFVDSLNDIEISVTTLVDGLELFDYMEIEFSSDSLENRRLAAFVELLNCYAKKAQNECSDLYSLYAAAHPSSPTVVAMEYANRHKSVVRVFLSDNNILMQRVDTIRAIDLHVNDRVIHYGESLWPVIEKRTGNTVPFPDCIGD